MENEITNDIAGVEKVEIPAQEKKFTQADVDKIIKERLKREQESYKNKEDSILSEVDSLRGNVGKYEEEFRKLITPQLSQIPEEFKELVDKLPLLEQVEFMNKLASKKEEAKSKVRIPATPQQEDIKQNAQQKPVGRII